MLTSTPKTRTRTPSWAIPSAFRRSCTRRCWAASCRPIFPFPTGYRLRGYLYFTRTEEGKQYPLHYRKRDTEGADEELLLDLNALAAGHSFLSLGTFAVSDDNSLLAYSLDTTGFRQYTLHIKDLRDDQTLTERMERVTSAATIARFSIQSKTKRPSGRTVSTVTFSARASPTRCSTKKLTSVFGLTSSARAAERFYC